MGELNGLYKPATKETRCLDEDSKKVTTCGLFHESNNLY